MSLAINVVSSRRLEVIIQHLTQKLDNDSPAGRRMGTEDRMIRSAVEIDGYVNPIAYDPTHKGEYGYYVCKTCKQLWSNDPESLPFDEERCLKRRIDKHPNAESSKDVIYVMGPNDNGVLLNFPKVTFAMLQKWGAVDAEKIKANLQWDREKVIALIKPML